MSTPACIWLLHGALAIGLETYAAHPVVSSLIKGPAHEDVVSPAAMQVCLGPCQHLTGGSLVPGTVSGELAKEAMMPCVQQQLCRTKHAGE